MATPFDTLREFPAECGRGCTEMVADAACSEHGVVAYLRGLLDEPAVACDPEDPNAPKAGA